MKNLLVRCLLSLSFTTGFISIGGAMEITQQEGQTGQLGQAATAGELEAVMDRANAQLQGQKGDSEAIQQADAARALATPEGGRQGSQPASHADNKGSFDEQKNVINYNVSPAGFNKVENIVGTLAHENTHKVISETTFAKQHINQDQEEAVARQVEWVATHAAKIVQRNQGLQPTQTDHIEWNKQNRDALQSHNQQLAAVDPDGVKPRVLEKFDKLYWAVEKNRFLDKNHLSKNNFLYWHIF